MKIIVTFLLFIVSKIIIAQTEFFDSKQFDSMPNGFQISIGYIENNQAKFIGYQKKDNQILFIENRDSIFEIGSITKVFTSTLLANLVIEKKVKLNDKVNKYYNFKFYNNAKITFVNLSNHTSGLYRLPSNMANFLFRNPSNPYKEYREELLFEYLKKELTFEFPSGTKYSYSNLGAGLLGNVITKIENKSYESILQNRICKKYKMSSTTSISNHHNVVKGLDQNGKETSFWDFNALIGAGGIYSTTSDLMNFIQAHFEENTVLELTRQPTFKVSDSFEMGLGLHIFKDSNHQNIYFHNGATGGFRSSLGFNPIAKRGIVILSNISPLHRSAYLIDEMCFKFLRKEDF